MIKKQCNLQIINFRILSGEKWEASSNPIKIENNNNNKYRWIEFRYPSIKFKDNLDFLKKNWQSKILK